MLSIDLNCDMGEGMEQDPLLMKYISSANIACGGHAGNSDSIKRTIELALQHKVAVGAHPSYIDKENFGRVDLLNNNYSFDKLRNDLVKQLTEFSEICRQFGITAHHVKPHGALYNRAAKDSKLAALICSIVLELGYPPVLYGLSGSEQEKITAAAGIRFVHEVFSDRTYQNDGTLTPRTSPGALIEDEETCLNQVLGIIKTNTVSTVEGQKIGIKADTLCVHGDGSHALQFASSLRSMLDREGIAVIAP